MDSVPFSDEQAMATGHDSGFVEINRIQADFHERLSGQESNMVRLLNQVERLTENVATLSLQFAQASRPVPPPMPRLPTAVPYDLPVPESKREPKVQLPNRYDGQPDKCRNFLAQCEICFRAQPSRYGTEDSRICFILSLLGGKALDWVGPLIRNNSEIVNSLDKLRSELISVFDHSLTEQEAATRLMNLTQGKNSVAEFSILFRSVASSTGWADGPLMSLFIRALSEPVRDALAMVETPKSLDALVQVAIRVDNRVREREKERLTIKGRPPQMNAQYSKLVAVPAPSTPPPDSDNEPMQVDGAVVRNPMNKRKIICYHCRKPGHIKPRCPDLNI